MTINTLKSKNKIDLRLIWNLSLSLVLLLWCDQAIAGQLAERLATFPNWQHSASVQAAKGDLGYPEWMTGTWNVTSTLVDLVAPLAPDVVTPGFESNRRYLNQPVKFQVRFVKANLLTPLFQRFPQSTIQRSPQIISDRAFNGLNLARAYLGETVIAVKVDPANVNRQITLLRSERQLVSIVTGRATESTPDAYITTEVFQQVFRSGTMRPYFNTVETTTAYKYLALSQPTITAEQATAVYLSPQDPNYFVAKSHPVALYRYRLEFFPVVSLP